MIRLRVERSPVRLFLMGVVGLVLVFAAIDIMWVHRISTPPLVNEDGTLTTKGSSQQRADFVWGSVFLAGGGVLFVTGLAGLLRRRPAIVVMAEGVEVFVTGPRTSTFVPWDDVLSVTSGTDLDVDGGGATPVYRLDLHERGDLPEEPWGAEWHGSVLAIDAAGWAIPVEEVAVRSQLAWEEHRRKQAAG